MRPLNLGLTAQARAHGETLIRTALVSEFNSARLQEFSDQGVRAIEWVSTIDDATTAECEELDGKQWLMPEDPEDYASYEPIGHDIPFPGPIGPHIWNCRSTQIPVEDDLRRELPLQQLVGSES